MKISHTFVLYYKSSTVRQTSVVVWRSMTAGTACDDHKGQ